MKMLDALKRRLLGGKLKTIERDGKWYAIYDGMSIYRVGSDKFQIRLMIGSEIIHEFEEVRLLQGDRCTFTSGIEGLMEINLDG